jgi:hypothetical protein
VVLLSHYEISIEDIDGKTEYYLLKRMRLRVKLNMVVPDITSLIDGIEKKIFLL